MDVKGILIIVTIAAVATLIVSNASAVPATVHLTTYLRTGPGNQYAVLDEIRPEARVDVDACQDGWCRVKSDEHAGYIEAYVLSAPDIHGAPPAAPPSGPCITARLNGMPRAGDTVRICDR